MFGRLSVGTTENLILTTFHWKKCLVSKKLYFTEHELEFLLHNECCFQSLVSDDLQFNLKWRLESDLTLFRDTVIDVLETRLIQL